MSKPTIVLVPGSWHTPEVYSKVMTALEKHGYPTVGCPLPSVGADTAHADFWGDVHAIRDCLTGLVDQGKEVVLVTHSYSGMPGAEAPVDLGKDQRRKKGLPGGVVRLVFIQAFAMPEGFQPTAGGAQFPDWMKVDSATGMVRVGVEDAKRIFYNDISSEEGEEWARKLLPESVGVYSSTTTYAAWRYIPSTYVIGTKDNSTFTPEVVDYMISNSKKEQPTAFDQIERCDGGHCLMISHADWLAQVLRRAAGEMV